MSTIYENILSLCDETGIKPGKMCADLGFSRSLMSDLKYGRKKGITGATAQKIADYFGVSIERVLVGKEKSAANSGDAELNEYLEELRSRPEMRMLFHTFAGATKEQVEAIVKAWEAMQQK